MASGTQETLIPQETEEAQAPGNKGFWGLIGLQFQGAFSDNLFKQVLILLVLTRFSESESLAGRWVALITALFSIPYLIFAGWTGALSDRISKRLVVLSTKIAEVAIMTIGGITLWLYTGGQNRPEWAFYAAIGVLFLMATQSSFFSPSKYGILPELLRPSRLTWGNGILEMTTFLAILTGVVGGNLLYRAFLDENGVPVDLQWISVVLVALSFAGLASGWFIKRVPAARPDLKVRLNHFPQLWENMKVVMSDRVLTLTVFGISYFWFLGALVMANAPIWGMHYLGMNEFMAGMLMAVMAIGIGAGSITVGTLSRRGIEIGFVPLGGFGMALFALVLAFAEPGEPHPPGFAAVQFARADRMEEIETTMVELAEAGQGEAAALGLRALAGAGETEAYGRALAALGEAGYSEVGRTALAGGIAPDAERTLAAPWMLGLMGLSLALMGFFAGFYSVPLNALLQQRAPAESRGGVIAALNFVNFTGVLLSSALFVFLIAVLEFTAANIFAIVSLVTFLMTLFLITLMPEALLGLVSTVITRFVYRIRILGQENIPRKGPAVLMSNHISMVDALLITVAARRPVRFIVWKEIFDNPLLGFFLKIMKAIPISSDQRPRSIIASLSKAADALNEGELVCVFSEGQVTRAGLPMPYRRGFKHILDKAPVPIVPIYLDGVWGTIFSYERKKFQWSWPKRLRYDVTVAVGKPLAHDSTYHEMYQSVMELSAECALAKKDRYRPLHFRFIRGARSHPLQFCVGDSTREPLKYYEALVGGILLARRLKSVWGDQQMVGIYLPPTVAGVVVNLAASLSGRTAVNLNYTTTKEILNHCIETCELKTVVTSKLFLRKLKQEAPPGAVFMEDVVRDRAAGKGKFAARAIKLKATLTERVPALLAAFFLPIRWLESYCGSVGHRNADDLATIIFSSGSTGMPKGIMLSHFNVCSNVESFEKAVSLWADDRVMGFLPFFHSFGFTVTLWGGLHIGYGVIHHPNPLEAKVIGDLVEEYKMTVLIGTPTFLQHYIRRVEPEKFRSLEFVLTGAEKLPARVAEAFEERFGQRVYEGYGTTECAPVVAVNVDDYRNKGHHHVGNRPGSVGHAIPGVAVRIGDAQTGVPVVGAERGMVYVRGANVMLGYYKLPEMTHEALQEGWYKTGDLGFIDDDGFLHITDRLSRFSKIAGEMVPHGRIEEELHLAIDAEELAFAVTSVPDEHKGERIVVLHTTEEDRIAGALEKLRQAGIPSLWVPRRGMFFKVDEIPILGTGKLDLARVRELAHRLVEGEPVGAAVAPNSSGEAEEE